MSIYIKWNRSDDGYVVSADGCFHIEPLWMGRTTPQAYKVSYKRNSNTPSESIACYCNTQTEAKDRAVSWIYDKIKNNP